MMTTLSGTLELWGGQLVAFTAHLTPEIDTNGLRVYRAALPMFFNPDGAPQLIRGCHVEVLPAMSTLDLVFDPDLPHVAVPADDTEEQP